MRCPRRPRSAPSTISGSISPLMTSTMMSSSRVTDRGVNAFDTSRRSRVWSSPFIASRLRGGALPQRARRDALRLEAEPLRHLEPGVAQRGCAPVRSSGSRDRAPPSRSAPARGLCVGFGGLRRGLRPPRTRRSAGRFEHARDAHGHLLGLGTIDTDHGSAGPRKAGSVVDYSNVSGVTYSAVRRRQPARRAPGQTRPAGPSARRDAPQSATRGEMRRAGRRRPG